MSVEREPEPAGAFSVETDPAGAFLDKFQRHRKLNAEAKENGMLMPYCNQFTGVCKREQGVCLWPPFIKGQLEYLGEEGEWHLRDGATVNATLHFLDKVAEQIGVTDCSQVTVVRETVEEARKKLLAIRQETGLISKTCIGDCTLEGGACRKKARGLGVHDDEPIPEEACVGLSEAQIIPKLVTVNQSHVGLFYRDPEKAGCHHLEQIKALIPESLLEQ